MAKSVWKALWLMSTEYRGLQEYLMVQKHGGGRMTYKDAAVYHRYTMRHCPHQDRKATGEWVSLPSVRYSKPKRPLPWKEKNMSGVQHPCNVLHYLRKWLSSNDEFFVGMLIVPEKGLCVDIKWINEVKKLLFKGIIVTLRNFYTKYLVIQNILRTFVA